MSPKTASLGAFIRQHRQAAGITLPELAARMKVSKSMVLYWERGERTPVPASLQKLATALHLDFEDLFSLAGYTTPQDFPALPIYLRKKHHLSQSEAERVERYVTRIKGQKGGGRVKRDR